jgi:hypothetical protein
LLLLLFYRLSLFHHLESTSCIIVVTMAVVSESIVVKMTLLQMILDPLLVVQCLKSERGDGNNELAIEQVGRVDVAYASLPVCVSCENLERRLYSHHSIHVPSYLFLI